MDILGMSAAEVDQKTGEDLVELVYRAAYIARVAEALLVRASGAVQEECEGVPVEESLARRYGAKNAQELLRMVTLAPSRVVAGRLRLAATTRSQVTLTGQVLPPKCPFVSKALEEGALPVESATHITGLIEKTELKAHSEDLRAAERHLVEAAAGMGFTMNESTGEVTVEEPLVEPGERGGSEEGPAEGGGGGAGNGDVADGPDGPAGGIDGLGGSPVVRVPLDADAVRGVCTGWEAGLDPDGCLPSEAEMMRRRSVRFGSSRGGLVSLYMDLLPEVAAKLSRMFDALGNPRVRNHPTGGDPRGEETTAGSLSPSGGDSAASSLTLGGEGGVSSRVVDGRTPDQKRHDMFATVLDTALRSGELPSLGGAAVTVMIQTTEENLTSNTGVAWLHDWEGKKSPVHPRVVRQSACSGAIQRVFQDGNGRLIGLGSVERVFNAHQRRAILTRDGGCVIPGCTIPGTWCEIHHVTPHAYGGETHTDNGVLLCWHHHRTLDTSGWRITMEKGIPKIQPPPWPTNLWQTPPTNTT